MAGRWFGPRPLYQPIAIGWPNEIARHGSCGCCGCGGLYSTSAVADLDGLFTKYAAYRDGLRLKLVISGVPDAFSVALNPGYPIYITTATGMSQYNGTWYFDIVRTQYGCILSASDEETFDVAYQMSDPDFGYDIPYTQRVTLGAFVSRSGDFLQTIGPFISHYSPDYYSDVMLSGLPYGTSIHPMIGLAFEPSDSQYPNAGGTIGYAPDAATLIESFSTAVDAARLSDTIAGNLRFRLSEALIEQDPIDFTNPDWEGIGTFWDTATNSFKVAGTFTAQIERL